MAEVLGVVAASGQLAAVCLGLLDLMAKIKRAPATLSRCQRQFQELHDLSVSISQNPLLQTPEVASLTQSLLSVVDDSCIEPLLRKNPFLRTWGLIRKDRHLAQAFDVLGQQKATLSLIIHDVQAKALHQIQSELQVMTSGSHCRSRSTDSGIDSEMAGESSSSAPGNRKIVLLPPQQEEEEPIACDSRGSESDGAPDMTDDEKYYYKKARLLKNIDKLLEGQCKVLFGDITANGARIKQHITNDTWKNQEGYVVGAPGSSETHERTRKEKHRQQKKKQKRKERGGKKDEGEKKKERERRGNPRDICYFNNIELRPDGTGSEQLVEFNTGKDEPSTVRPMFGRIHMEGGNDANQRIRIGSDRSSDSHTETDGVE